MRCPDCRVRVEALPWARPGARHTSDFEDLVAFPGAADGQGPDRPPARGRWVKCVRWSLLKAPERQSVEQLAALCDVQHVNHRLYRAFLLREQLRLLYHLDDPGQTSDLLDAWLAWASRSKLRPSSGSLAPLVGIWRGRVAGWHLPG